MFSLLPVLLFSSCDYIAELKVNKDSTNVILPVATSIPSAELKKYREACETWYDTTLLSNDINGGVLVAIKGNIVLEKYVGSAHYGGNDSITAATSFHIASVSKTFTAMAVLKLCEQKRISLDAPFSRYFPDFNYPGVTVRTLLNHRSGLPNYVYFMEKLGWDKNKWVRNEDILSTLINRKAELKDIGKPDTYFAYCNTNYALLALLLEKVSGKKYGELLKELFFQPLQMRHTFVFDTSAAQRVAPSYDWRGHLIPFNFLDAVYGDKNIYSTPRDLFAWDFALRSGRLFSDSTLQAAYRPYSNEHPGIRNYGLGWRMNIFPNGQKMIYHNGWWHGNNACFLRLLADSAVIIALGNKFTRKIYSARELAGVIGTYDANMEESE